jgi:hypothetical protein
LRGRRVLLVGAAAERAALRTLVRLAGARVMAAKDVGIAYSLLLRFPIDIIVGDPQLRTADGEPFEKLVSRCAGQSRGALWVEIPARIYAGDAAAFPPLRIAHSRPSSRRALTQGPRARRRGLVRRAS